MGGKRDSVSVLCAETEDARPASYSRAFPLCLYLHDGARRPKRTIRPEENKMLKDRRRIGRLTAPAPALGQRKIVAGGISRLAPESPSSHRPPLFLTGTERQVRSGPADQPATQVQFNPSVSRPQRRLRFLVPRPKPTEHLVTQMTVNRHPTLPCSSNCVFSLGSLWDVAFKDDLVSLMPDQDQGV